MPEIRITEGIPEGIPAPPTWCPGREPDESFCVIAHSDDWRWQDLPDHILGEPSSLGRAKRFLGDGWSFDKIPIPHYMGSMAFVVLPDEIPGLFHNADYLNAVGDVYNAVRDLHAERVARIYCPTLAISTTSPATLGVHPIFFADTFETPSDRENPLIHEFALGLAGTQPDRSVVEMAARIVRAAHDFTIGHHITVDAQDGELDFHLRLADGLLVMANLFPDGTIDASVYDDSQGAPVTMVKRMRRATTSEHELTTLFRAGLHASIT